MPFLNRYTEERKTGGFLNRYTEKRKPPRIVELGARLKDPSKLKWWEKELAGATGYVTFVSDIAKEFGKSIAEGKPEEIISKSKEMAKSFGGGVRDWIVAGTGSPVERYEAMQRIAGRVKQTGVIAEAAHPLIVAGLTHRVIAKAKPKPIPRKKALVVAEPKLEVPPDIVQQILQKQKVPVEQVPPLMIPERTTYIPDFVLGKEGRLYRTTKKRTVKVGGKEFRPEPETVLPEVVREITEPKKAPVPGEVELKLARKLKEKPVTEKPAPSTEILPVNKLPEYAQKAIAEEGAEMGTGYYANSLWQKEIVPVNSFKGQESLTPREYKGSVTKGAIVVDRRGAILDGHNRLYEAFKRGDETIEVWRERPTKPVTEKPAKIPASMRLSEVELKTLANEMLNDAKIIAPPSVTKGERAFGVRVTYDPATTPPWYPDVGLNKTDTMAGLKSIVKDGYRAKNKYAQNLFEKIQDWSKDKARYEPPTAEITGGDLMVGDRIKIQGEWYTAKPHPETGTIELIDAQNIKLDIFEKLPVQELQKAKPAVKGIKRFLVEEKGAVELPDFREVGKKTRAFIKSVKKRFPELEGEVEGQYIPRSTDELSIKARNLIKDDIGTAERLARTGTNESAVATSAELLKHYNDLAQKAKTTGEANVFYGKAAEIATTIAPQLTELGRGVQAATILSRLTPEGQVRFAAREIARYNEALKPWRKRIPDLTGEQTRYITEEMKRIQKMPDGEARAIAFWNIQTYIADLIPSSWYKKIVNFWKAGLLTGIKTTGLNLGATFGNIYLETLKDIPAVTLDILIPGKRTTAFTLRGKGKGVVTGFRRGWRYFKTGYDERNIGIKLDYKRVNYGKSKFAKGVQWYVDHVFRSMGGEDQPFFYGARNKSLYSQAIAQAKNRGLRGAESKAFVEELVKNPTDEMTKYAVLDGEIAVHQNKTALGEAGRQIQKVPGGAFVVPFTRTPAAVAMQMVNYSPAGIVKTIAQNIGKGRFDKRLFVQGIGRGITGTAILYIGKELFDKGLMTLDWPQNERERKLWELEGKKANAIKWGGKWRSANILGPQGFVMLVGGHFKQGMDETGSAWGGMTQAMGGSAKSLSEQTFLKGLNQTVAALNSPQRFATWQRGMTGSAIPTIVGDIARAIDPKQRRVLSPLESLVSRVPFARETLEPRVEVLGKDLVRGGTFLETMIDPSRPTTIKDSPVVTELRRLWEKEYRVSPTQLGDRRGYEALTKEQNTLLWQKSGLLMEQSLARLISLPDYQGLADDEKADAVNRIVGKSKLMTRVAFTLRLVRGLKGDQLINRLKELAEGGLVNRQILREVEKELK